MERGVRRREDRRLLERPLDSALGVEAATARLSLPCRADGTTADRPHQEEPAQLGQDHGLSWVFPGGRQECDLLVRQGCC